MAECREGLHTDKEGKTDRDTKGKDETRSQSLVSNMPFVECIESYDLILHSFNCLALKRSLKVHKRPK